MQVGFTISGVVEIPNQRDICSMRKALIEKLSKELLPSLRTAGLDSSTGAFRLFIERDVQKWLDENLVEYDPLEPPKDAA